MTQKFTILFDLDGTLVDTAPDLMNAHNHVMRKFGYETKSTDDIRKLVGQGAGSLIGRSVWGQAKKELKKINDDKIKNEMVTEFIDFYGKNIANESKKEKRRWKNPLIILMQILMSPFLFIMNSIKNLLLSFNP